MNFIHPWYTCIHVRVLLECGTGVRTDGHTHRAGFAGLVHCCKILEARSARGGPTRTAFHTRGNSLEAFRAPHRKQPALTQLEPTARPTAPRATGNGPGRHPATPTVVRTHLLWSSFGLRPPCSHNGRQAPCCVTQHRRRSGLARGLHRQSVADHPRGCPRQRG